MINAKSVADITNQVATGEDTAVLFTAPSFCGPCRAIKPHWNALDDKTDVTLVTADLDTVPDAGLVYRIQGVPTLMFFVDGVYVKHLKGRTVLQLQSELAKD